MTSESSLPPPKCIVISYWRLVEVLWGLAALAIATAVMPKRWYAVFVALLLPLLLLRFWTRGRIDGHLMKLDADFESLYAAGDFAAALARVRGDRFLTLFGPEHALTTKEGIVYAAAGDHANAVRLLSESLPSTPTQTWATVAEHLALSLEALGRTAEAAGLRDQISSARTGSTDTGSTDTGSTDTGSTDTGSTGTGSTGTGSTGTGSTGTGSRKS